VFAPGEAYQFDWSHEIVILAGVPTKAKVAQVRLCHSRMPFVRAYPRESQEMVFDAHEKAFQFFKGGCQRGIYDNMRTAVDAVFVGKERKFNRRFQQLMSHHLVEPTACTPRAGWEKGQVENQVGTLRNRLFKPRPKFDSYEDLNAYLLEQCIAFAKSQPHPEQKDKMVFEMFEGERLYLVHYRGPFDGFHATSASVSKTCLVRFDNNKYSVSAKAVGRPVDVYAYAERVVIKQDGLIVGEHARRFGPQLRLPTPAIGKEKQTRLEIDAPAWDGGFESREPGRQLCSCPDTPGTTESWSWISARQGYSVAGLCRAPAENQRPAARALRCSATLHSSGLSGGLPYREGSILHADRGSILDAD
jgi:Integrase core domain